MKLKIKGEVFVSNVVSGMFLDPIRCDSRGNIYLRAWQSADAFETPITKLSPGGERLSVVAISGVSGYEQAQLLDFAVGPRGGTYALALRVTEGKREADVLSFQEDGSFQTATKLEKDFTPLQILVLANGEFFVSGWTRQDVSPPTPPPSANGAGRGQQALVEPFTGIFDGVGKLLREIPLEREGTASDRPGSGAGLRIPSREISLGRTVIGDDGNVYFMLRRATKPKVYVVSPAGIVVHTFEVTPPYENAPAFDMRSIPGNKLIFEFQREIGERKWEWQSAIFSVVDAETGARELDYQSSAEIGGAFACYSPNDGFTFLRTSKDGRLVLSRVGP
ncbi:MAG TPA: hypothetical protein VL099_04750 [Candidatus Binatia bacterium]|nr:hypothetical protein [Candidatus Binatia bacterium]